MDKRTIILVVLFFVLIVAGMFAFAYMKRTEIVSVPETVKPSDEIAVPYANITRVDAKHFFVDGVHTLVGQIEMPTPCDLLEGESIIKESMPEQVELAFTVVNNSQMCAQVITPARFSVTAKASEQAAFFATFMGRKIELNLIPAAAGETPEEFELFIKG